MELNLMEKNAIEARVKEYLEKFGYSFDEDTSVNVVDFARGHGFTVGNAELDDSEDGFIAILPSSSMKGTGTRKVIGVNLTRDYDFKRFIIAHEFAHYALHYKAGEIYLHREHVKGKDDKEQDADYFAAALLMPAKSFLRTYEQLKGRGLSDKELNYSLAEAFRVPVESAARRVSEVQNLKLE